MKQVIATLTTCIFCCLTISSLAQTQAYYNISATSADGVLNFPPPTRPPAVATMCKTLVNESVLMVSISPNDTSISIYNSGGEIVYSQTLLAPKSTTLIITTQGWESDYYTIIVQSADGTSRILLEAIN